MPGQKPSVRPRPGGGFNQGLGAFGEHLDEAAVQQAMTQKTSAQQGSQLQPGLGAAQAQQALQQQRQQQPPREVGTIQQELITRPIADGITQLRSLFDLHALLGIERYVPSPQEQQHQQQMLQRFNQLGQEQQGYAKRDYQERMQRQQQEEEERQAKQAQHEQAAQVIAPASPQKGPVGPGGKKPKNSLQQMQMNRGKLGSPQSAS